MANKRITDVDFIDSLNSNESFFVNQNSTIKQISKSNIVFDIVNGGTGADNISDARTNLGLGLVATENVVPISEGGTGATDSAVALENLGAAAVGHTHTASEIGAAESSHSHNASDIASGTLSSERLPVVSISKGGTGSSNGATGLKNLFAAGNTILSSYQYGSTLPSAGNAGRIFFLKA